jgi:hypothetical protein
MSRYLVRSLSQILERDRGKHPGLVAVPYNAIGDDPPPRTRARGELGERVDRGFRRVTGDHPC